MASIQLTQVNLVAANPPSVYIKVDNSESLLAINPASIAAVGPAYNPDGTIIDVRQVYITGSMLPIYVTDSYAAVKAYIDAL